MTGNWKDYKIIRDFYQIEEDGSMPEGSRILLDATDLVTFEPGEDIVTYGASADDGMYIILEGKTEVLAANGVLISEQESGDVVGELAVQQKGIWCISGTPLYKNHENRCGTRAYEIGA